MDHTTALFGITLCFSAVYGQVITPGFCQNIPSVMPFLLGRYLGTWYEFERFYNQELQGITCARSDYNPGPDNTLQVITTGIKRRSCKPVRLEGVGIVYDPIGEPARGQLTYCPSTQVLPLGNYWVVDTDYDTYSVVYSCNQVGLFKVESAYILLRQPMSLRVDLLQSIYKFLRCYGINPRNFIRTNFNTCRRRTRGAISYKHCDI